MSVNAIKEQNHRYSLDIPDRVYTALKVKAAVERKTVRDIILSSLQEVLGDDFASLPLNEQKEILSFTGMSTKIFAEEWESEEDDKAFKDIPSPINFHNHNEAEEWVRDTVERRPYRQDFFNAFSKEINSYFKKPVTILEIGSGPGHLAKHILENCNVESYKLLDFSAPMHEIAKNNLGELARKAIFLQKDFKSSDWYKDISKVDIIVTMQAIHEVRHKSHIGNLFSQLRSLIKEDGVFLYSDHYYSTDSKTKNPELYLTLNEQPKLLNKSGFCQVKLIFNKCEMALYIAKIKGSYGKR